MSVWTASRLDSGRAYVSFSKVTVADLELSAPSEVGVTESDVILPLTNTSVMAFTLRFSF